MNSAVCLPGSAERRFHNVQRCIAGYFLHFFTFMRLKRFLKWADVRRAELLCHSFKGNYFITLPCVNSAAHVCLQDEHMHQHTQFTQIQQFIIQALVGGGGKGGRGEGGVPF